MLFKCDTELPGARLHIFKKPRVLDCDDSLVGEGLDQRDLLFGEGPNGASSKRDHADRLSLPHERHPEQRAEMAEAPRLIPAIVWIPIHILNLNALAFEQGSTGDVSSLRLYWNGTNVLNEFGGKP